MYGKKCFGVPLKVSPSLQRINLELTYRCNLHCGFCFLAASRLLNKRIKEMDTAQILDFIGSLEERPEFYITGGEPFLRKDCVKIVRKIKEKGLACGINTNGMLLDKKKIKELANAGLNYIIFSLHGLEKTQGEITGSQINFRQTIRNMAEFIAKKQNTEVIMTSTLHAINAGEIQKLYFLGKKIGVDRVIFEHLQFLRKEELLKHRKAWRKYFPCQSPVITPVYSQHPQVDVITLMKDIALTSKICDGQSHFEVRPRFSADRLCSWYQDTLAPRGDCSLPWRTMVIGPDGQVRACQLYEKKLGNITRTDYRDIWQGKEMNAFRNALSEQGGVFPGCVRCCQRFKIYRYR
jgi:radical SAM protein with 4Fe4S-binding SPASM domain